jgi:hypothetical protein
MRVTHALDCDGYGAGVVKTAENVEEAIRPGAARLLETGRDDCMCRGIQQGAVRQKEKDIMLVIGRVGTEPQQKVQALACVYDHSLIRADEERLGRSLQRLGCVTSLRAVN